MQHLKKEIDQLLCVHGTCKPCEPGGYRHLGNSSNPVHQMIIHKLCYDSVNDLTNRSTAPLAAEWQAEVCWVGLNMLRSSCPHNGKQLASVVSVQEALV